MNEAPMEQEAPDQILQEPADSGMSLGMVFFACILFDTAFSYFLPKGSMFRVNALAPVYFLIMLMKYGWSKVIPPAKYCVLLYLFVISIGIGYFTIPHFVYSGWHYNFYGFADDKFLLIANAVCVFLIGYAAIANTSSDESVAKTFLFVGLVYGLICVIALKQWLPNYFPMDVSYYASGGKLISRPAITTNQNYQVYYLFPVILPLALQLRFARSALCLAGVACAAFTLLRIQSRSGLLVFAALGVICLLVPFFSRSRGRARSVVLFICFALALLVFYGTIREESAHILNRFADRTETTTSGRIVSFLYLLEKITDLRWWLPQGTLEFLRGHQVEPHCTPTLMFCDAGMLGLISWIMLICAPAIALMSRLIRGGATGKTAMVALGGIGSLVLQLSLPAHLNKQVWLWAGAVVACLTIDHLQSRPEREAQIPWPSGPEQPRPEQSGPEQSGFPPPKV